MGRTLLWLIPLLALVGGATVLLLEEDEPAGTGGFDPLTEEPTADRSGPALEALGTRRAMPGPGGVAGRYTVTGRCVDAEGVGQADVPIVARRIGDARDPSSPSHWQSTTADRVREAVERLENPPTDRPAVVAETTTDADGSFRLPLTTSGRFEIQAQPAAPRYGTSTTAHLHPKQTGSEVTLRVEEGTPLRGRIETLQGAPLGGIVFATWWRNEGTTHLRWSGDPVEAAAADGRFRLDAVPAGRVSLSLVLASGRRVSDLTVETPHPEEFLIRLDDSTGRIACTVSDEAGTPIPNATVMLTMQRTKDETRAGGSQSVHGTTDAEGICRISNAPLGRVIVVRAAAQGFLGSEEYGGQAAWKDLEVKAGSEASLALTLFRGGTIVGRVTEQGTEVPLAEASVSLFALRTTSRSAQRERLAPVQTDASGTFRIHGVPMGRYVALPERRGWFLPESKPGAAQPVYYGPDQTQAPASLLVAVTEDGAEVERNLVLAKGHDVRGVVVGPDGDGVADAEVHAKGYGVMQRAWQWGIQPRGEEPLARTAADGSFHVEGLPPQDRWSLFARKSGYAARYGAPFTLPAAGAAPEVKLELSRGATVRGSIQGLEGAALAEAQVGFWGTDSELAGDRSFRQVGADGTFELTGLPPGTWTLNVWMNGRQGVQKQVSGLQAGEVREGIVLEVKQGVEVSGVLVDKEGEPVSHHQVMLQSQGGGGGWMSTQTDGQGRFRFDGVTAGPAQLMTFSGGRQKSIGESFEAPARDLRVVFVPDPVVTLKGTVLAPDGTPIPVARIRIQSRASATPGPMNAYNVPGQGATEVLNGIFELQVTGRAPFVATVSGARDKTGTALNYSPKQHTIENAEEEILIRLEEGFELAGTVVDAGGAPVQGVPIRLRQRVVETDAQGRFQLPGLGPDAVYLQIGPLPGYATPSPLQLVPPRTDVRITLEKGLSIQGRAEGPDGAPVERGWVNASWKRAEGQRNGHASAQLQSDGSFTLEGFPEGVSVTVSIQIWNQAGGQAYAPTQVENVRPGTDDLVVRMGSGLTAEGIVLQHDGKPAAGVFVGAKTADGSNLQTGWAQTDEKGRWKLAGLRDAPYEVMVMRPNGGVQPPPTKISPPAAGIRISLPESIRVHGRLAGLAEGMGAEWAVHASGSDGKVLKRTGVQADGTWTLDGLPAGMEITLTASRVGDERYAQHGPFRPAGKRVTLTLQLGQSIRGTVDRSAAPVGSVSVWTSGSGLQTSARVEDDGSFVVTGLPPGSYTLQARCGTARARLDNVAAGASGQVLTLALPK